MPDSIAITIAGRRLEKFLSYRIEADLYCADHMFRFDLHDPGFAIAEGARCEVRVNGQLILTGIVDAVTDGDDKRGSHLSIEGRDLMGLLVDSYVETYPDLRDITIQALAEKLLATVPYIDTKAIVYQGGIAGENARGTQAGAAGIFADMGKEKKNVHVEPGQTIFDVLKRAAQSRGATFFCLPDGTFVFGRPKAAGRPAFSIVHRTDGVGNNAFRATRRRDISRRYSKISVVGQQQGQDVFAATGVNVQASLTDDTVPFHKPLVVVLNDDGESPAQYARQLLEMQRAEGLQIAYSLKGHSQNGRNFTINELARVRDTLRGLDGVYLIVARTFMLSKDDGQVTELRLGHPGVVA